MQRTLYSGAWKPRVLRAILRRNSAKSPGFFLASSIFSLRSRIFSSGRFSASTFWANATALRGEVAARDLVDETVGERLLAADRVAHRAHLERLGHADHARQPLGAAGAGEQADLDFGLAVLRLGVAHAVVRAHRDLEPAAERGAVNGRDHRLGAVLHRVLHFAQAGAARRLVELADVGAGDESAALAREHDRLDVGVRDRLLHALGEALADVPGQSVDRRVVDQKKTDIALLLETYGFGDGCHVNSTLQAWKTGFVGIIDSIALPPMVCTIGSARLLLAPRTAHPTTHPLRAMETRVLPRPTWTLVALAGRLDMISAGPLEQELEGLIGAGATRLAIDMGGLDYLSSAGLRALLVAARRLQEAQGTLVLVGLRGTVKEVLEIAGLTNVVPAYASESDLLAARADWR